MKQALKQDARRNACMLTGSFARKGYDWWWHSFTGVNRSTGEQKAFFIDYFICNPALGGEDPVLGQLPENRASGRRPSYLMVKAGCWGENAHQLHRFFGWNKVRMHKKAPYSVEAEDCFASDKELRGSIKIVDAERHPEYMCANGEMRWDLKVDKKIAYNVGYGACRLFRRLKAFEMYWHVEGMKTFYEGKVWLDGVEYDVKPETCYGYADKNWGRNFTSPWVWLSSCNLRSRLTGKRLENSVFDIGGGRPKAFGIALNRKLLGAICYEGEAYEFNFSKFWTGSKTRFKAEETGSSDTPGANADGEIVWHVRQENRRAVMETEVRCFKKDMIFVNYESPDGFKRHNRLWNGGTGTGVIKLWRKTRRGPVLIDEIEAFNIGCEYGEY